MRWVTAIAAAGLVLAGCDGGAVQGSGLQVELGAEVGHPTQGDVAARAGTGMETEAQATFSCGFLNVPIGPGVPGDTPLSASQLAINCFAWWEFISLNWPTSAKAFGQPGDILPVEWETYMTAEQLFLDDGAPPPEWGSHPVVPNSCSSLMKSRATPISRVLMDTSKFSADFIEGRQSQEAAPFGEPAWLGAQNGTNLWYEIRLSKDEYDTFVGNKWYTANGQAATVAANDPIVLPVGILNGRIGALELKAAWMEISNPSDPKWLRYKLSAGTVVDPAGGGCRDVTVALVALHILHKTKSQPTWLWATFEHQDNAPNAGDVGSGSAAAGGAYNFYSPTCSSQSVDVPNAKCLASTATSPVTFSCKANSPPGYYLRSGCPAPVPIQVTRTTPIDSNAVAANDTAHAAIVKYSSDSVWQYYDLVNVIWSTNPYQDPKGPLPIPRELKSMNPAIKVANTTLETYAQTNTCTDCHVGAHIAPTKKDPHPKWSSDFSFLFALAQEVPPTAGSEVSDAE